MSHNIYQHHIFFCTNERKPGASRPSCGHCGADKLRAYAKAKIKALGLPETRVNSAGCLDRCELGPVLVIYPEGIWYRYENESDIDEIFEMHFQNNNTESAAALSAPSAVVERLYLSREAK